MSDLPMVAPAGCPDCDGDLKAEDGRDDLFWCDRCRIVIPLAAITRREALRPIPGRKFLWLDGKLHDAPPPRDADLVIPAPPDWKPPEAAKPIWVGIDMAAPDVPRDFAFTDRTRLRMAALDFVLRRAAGGPTMTGQAILSEAEDLERWIVGPTK